MNTFPAVLHVEDDINDRLLVQAACKRAGLLWNSRTAADGEAAIAYLSGDGLFADRSHYPLPDLILLDLKLPRKSGFEVLEWIRGQQIFVGLPVIILTSSAQEKDIARAQNLGASDYYVKPVSIRELGILMKEIAVKWMEAQRVVVK
jgi:DNA-binding response OmpR family regulator